MTARKWGGHSIRERRRNSARPLSHDAPSSGATGGAGEQEAHVYRSDRAISSEKHMFWLFNKTGIMTVVGVLLLILAIYLLRGGHVSWPG